MIYRERRVIQLASKISYRDSKVLAELLPSIPGSGALLGVVLALALAWIGIAMVQGKGRQSQTQATSVSSSECEGI